MATAVVHSISNRSTFPTSRSHVRPAVMGSISEMEVDDPQHPDPELPNYWHLSSQTLSVEVSKDRLQARYTGDAGRHSTVVALQSNVCAPSAQLCYYYECLIVDRGLASKIGIGFTSGSAFKTTSQPGWVGRHVRARSHLGISHNITRVVSYVREAGMPH